MPPDRNEAEPAEQPVAVLEPVVRVDAHVAGEVVVATREPFARAADAPIEQRAPDARAAVLGCDAPEQLGPVEP